MCQNLVPYIIIVISAETVQTMVGIHHLVGLQLANIIDMNGHNILINLLMHKTGAN